MAYVEFPPTAGLERVVEFFWIYESDDRDLQRIPPDGRCELIVHVGDPYLETGESEPQPRALFAGQLTRALYLQGQGRASAISARLKPAAVSLLVHGDAAACNDRRIDLRTLDPDGAGQLIAAVLAAPDQQARVERLAAYVDARTRAATSGIDARVEHVVALLDAGNAASLAEIAATLDLSMRQLQRVFRWHVGVSPQLYASIVRFRKIFDALSAGARNLSDAAQIAGYSDHPQMAREFQRFLRCSATRFIRERAQLAAAMTRGRSMSP